MRCRDKHSYQRRIDLLLAEACRYAKMATVLSPDLLVQPDDIGHLFHVASSSYWTRGLYVECLVRKRQKIFGVCRKFNDLAYDSRIMLNTTVATLPGEYSMSCQASHFLP